MQVRFERFHAANPHVFDLLIDLARRWRAAGHTRCAIEVLFGALRWESGIKTIGEPFKLNNDFRSRYVRLIIERHPEFDGFFETRELKSR